MDMQKLIKGVLKYVLLFCFGFTVYEVIEMLYRGRTYWWSGVMGGIAFVLIGMVNELIAWEIPLIIQSVVGGGIVAVIEYTIGMLFNTGYYMWDYRVMTFNVNGMICLEFSLIWCVLSVLCIILDDWLRYWIFDEEKPRYRVL